MDSLEASRAQTRSRIAALRACIASHPSVSGWMVPSSDPHLSEYLPERWRAREWLSGFTGSVGTLIVTADFAGLWVDSRYWVQAETQLAGTGIEVMRIPGAASTAHLEWLARHLPPSTRFGVDGQVLGLAAARALRDALARCDVTLETGLDLVDEVWPERPGLPHAAIFEHEARFAPVSRADKLTQEREALQRAGASWHFISTLDDIAWLFNLRGADVSYNPVFVAHALIGMDSARLFVADGKVPADLVARLAADGVVVSPYEAAPAALGALENQAVLIDPRRTTFGLRQSLPESARVIEAINPSTLAKSKKNEREIAHVREAMEQDGVALVEFFAWFEGALGSERITELTIDERITAARARRPGFVCPSFATIAGFNANGAMPHYRATAESHAVIEGDGLLLIDSGGQYQFGTTDITRVVPVGTPSFAQRRDFTLVLKGMIALSMARFPKGTPSPLLDALARAPIWASGTDYGHGTGHGVGYFLNVHEGPQSISPHADAVDPSTAMLPGMITSNEPGIYRPGRWGVRIENLVLNVVAETTEFGEFLSFETLTLCPIDTRCIERALMRADEVDWLNAYHHTVRERLAPHVTGAALDYLQRRCQPI